MTIWFASGNAHKKTELAAILNANGAACNVMNPADAGLDFEPDETGTTFCENALLKARALYALHPGDRASERCLIIADDSGLCVDALGGRPGIFSARYAGASAGDAERNARLLEELGDNPRRSARFVCAMVLLCSPDRFYIAQETFEGEIVKGPEAVKGTGGFGYDPVFFLPGRGCTAAELSEDEKNTLSHRARAGKIIASLVKAYSSCHDSI